eukprot:3388084-Alexandrium_andersonii.AAC.1
MMPPPSAVRNHAQGWRRLQARRGAALARGALFSKAGRIRARPVQGGGRLTLAQGGGVGR